MEGVVEIVGVEVGGGNGVFFGRHSFFGWARGFSAIFVHTPKIPKEKGWAVWHRCRVGFFLSLLVHVGGGRTREQNLGGAICVPQTWSACFSPRGVLLLYVRSKKLLKNWTLKSKILESCVCVVKEKEKEDEKKIKKNGCGFSIDFKQHDLSLCLTAVK